MQDAGSSPRARSGEGGPRPGPLTPPSREGPGGPQLQCLRRWRGKQCLTQWAELCRRRVRGASYFHVHLFSFGWFCAFFSLSLYSVGEGGKAARALSKEPVAGLVTRGSSHPPHHAPRRPSSPPRHALRQPCNSMKPILVCNRPQTHNLRQNSLHVHDASFHRRRDPPRPAGPARTVPVTGPRRDRAPWAPASAAGTVHPPRPLRT